MTTSDTHRTIELNETNSFLETILTQLRRGVRGLFVKQG